MFQDLARLLLPPKAYLYQGKQMRRDNKPSTMRRKIKIVKKFKEIKKHDQTEDLLYKGSRWGER